MMNIQAFSMTDMRAEIQDRGSKRRERESLFQSRHSRLFDAWVNPHDDQPYSPSPELMGAGVQSWQEVLESTISDGTAITAASETIVVPDYTIPGNYFAPGRTLRVWANGTISTVVTTPGTGVWSIRWGGVAGTLLCKSAAQNFNTTAQTLVGWNLWALIVCRTAGASGTFLSAGELNCFNVLDSTSANLKSAVMGSAGTGSNAAVTVDTTSAKALSVTFTQTVATGSLVCQQRVLEALN